MAIRARLDEKSGKITLTHPDRPPLTFDPDGDQGAFIQWVRPLIPEGRAAPARLGAQLPPALCAPEAAP